MQPLRGDLRDRADDRGRRGHRHPRQRRATRCPAATSAPRACRWPTCTTDPDRLRRPIRRVGAGAEATWEEIGWDEALDLVADRLAATVDEHGPNAVGVYLGNPNVHSLGFATHGVPFVKSLRTRNRFSATLGRPDPAPVRGVAAVRPPAAAAGPGHRPDVVLPGPRRQPDGVQRLADDRAGLPAAGPRPQGARRPDGRARPAAHRDGQGRDRAPLRPAGLRRRRAAGDAARPASTRA